MKRQNYANQAANQEGRTVNGDVSRVRLALEALSDAELLQAHTWSRFAEDWKQRMIMEIRTQRGI